MPDIGRFFNVDPLSEKYVYNSTYAFSENKVISHRELEGLEAIPADNFKKSDQMLVVVALGRANGIYGDGISGNNTLYKNLPQNLQNDDGLALFISRAVNTQVITYAGSDSGITAKHIAETVANYRIINPDSKVALIGHSLGGKDVLDAANFIGENNDINNKVNLIMTLEAASISNRGSAYSTHLKSNSLNIVNFNSHNSSMKNGGGIPTSNNQNATTINLPKGTDHTNMDNTLAPFIIPILNRMNNGTDPIKLINNINFKNIPILNNGDLDPNKTKGTTGS